MVVKTYRGLLADGAQEKIPLSTKDGSVGYRIIKLQIITPAPGTTSAEHIVKLFKSSQSTIDALINFSDSDLLACAITHDYTSAHQVGWSEHIIFDQEIFNQDIYITGKDAAVGVSVNYYIELEQMKLDHTQNMSATLKAIRGSAVD